MQLPEDVRVFAEDYIYLLREGKIEKAKELLHPDIQKEVTDDYIKEIIEDIGRDEPVGINSVLHDFKETTLGAGYVLSVNIQYEEEIKSIIMAISDIEGQLRVVSLMAMDEGTSTTFFLLSNSDKLYDKLYKILGEPVELPSFKIFCVFFLVAIVLAIIQVVAMWKVYEKAGEAGWASLIPIYNVYVLARIGGKPGWMGIVAALAGFIPFVGPIIGWVLFIMISIGVAETFGKGILFGLGLCFLSWIFYPILGFGSADASGPAPKKRDFSGGAGLGFYAPEPAVDVEPAPAPVPMPDDPVSAAMFGSKPIPLEPEVPKETFIRFTCSCGKRFKVPLEMGGKMGKCPKCQKRIRIPDK